MQTPDEPSCLDPHMNVCPLSEAGIGDIMPRMKDKDEPILTFTKADVYNIAREERVRFKDIDWRKVECYLHDYCYEHAYCIWDAIRDALQD